MRRQLSFACEGQWLAATADLADGPMGVLIATGGTQTRTGSHRLFERLAAELAGAGYSCFRFDRRGIGESQGEDPGYRANGPDIQAAAAAFRAEAPALRHIIGLGLCDGATSLSLFGGRAQLSGLVLINPWLVEAKAGEPAAAAIGHHYRRQLLSIAGWKKLLSGSISYRKLLKGIAKVVKRPADNSLAGEVAASLALSGLPVELILAKDDATAIAADSEWNRPGFARAIGKTPCNRTRIESDAHTFSRPGDFDALRDACLAAICRLESSGRD